MVDSIPPMADAVKMCRKCGAAKSPTEFYAHAETRDRLMSHCKACHASYMRERAGRVARFCSECGTSIRCNSRNGKCRQCRKACECGAAKDPRAAMCRSCGMRNSAKAQWDNPVQRAKKMAGMDAAPKRPHRTYAELTCEHFTPRALDGRYVADYGPTRHRKIVYRYRWVWEKANGPIPKGYELHHINGDSTDDRLENLQLVTRSEHAAIHGARKRGTSKAPWWTCQHCGKEFQKALRGKQPRRFCSRPCFTAAIRKHDWRQRGVQVASITARLL